MTQSNTPPSDTAHQHWNSEWADLPADSKWRVPEEDVTAWAATLDPGSRILDLGAGVGRHALWLAQQGFVVTALDAAPEGMAAIAASGADVTTVVSGMQALPFDKDSFDHVLSWNVLYHGDEDVVLAAIGQIRRVLRPGGTYLGTMLSKRRLPHEQARPGGREVSRNTWVWPEEPGKDKHHPHYFCNAAELVALWGGFEVQWLEDREHEKPGSYHWHLIAERL